MPVGAGRRINQQLSSRPSHAITVISHYGHRGPSPSLTAAGMSAPVSLPAGIGNPGLPPRLENLGNESSHEEVMENENWKKAMEFCDQSWNFPNFAPEFYQIFTFSVDNKKCIIS